MFSPGDQIDDRYDILGPLGQGGMAYVFRAFDRRLERDVALKVLRPHLTDTDSERFRREIRALARLNHPGIVSIFDLSLGEHVYFAMEFIDGGPITDLGPLQHDPEALQDLLGAAATVARALGYVHRLGMVHRDLTPRNILLTSRRHAKVMDFGLVQLTEASRELTRTGFTLGTPQYMAPEQARGDATGAHTDLYAFGAVLYRTVTGVAPFEAENDQAVLYQHVYGELVPANELNPQVPDALVELLGSLLEKDPERRPTSALAVADTLKAIQDSAARQSTHIPLAGLGRCAFYPHGPSRPASLRRRWQVRLPEGPQWPAGLGAAEGFVLLGLRSDRIMVLRPADGGTVCSFEMDDEVSSAPAFCRGRLFAASRDGALQAISWPTGRPLWTDPEAGLVGLAPLGGTLLLSSARGALERRTLDNELIWRYQASSPASTPPTVFRDAAVFGCGDGWLHVVDANTGQGRYKVEVGAIRTAPAVADGIMLLSVRGGELHAFDLARREVVWSYDLDGELYGGPALWQRRLFVGAWDRTLRCLSLSSGHDLWERTLDERITATPVVAAGNLYVVTEGGQLQALDARSGRELWSEQASHSPIQASPLPIGDTLVIAALDGTVCAYR